MIARREFHALALAPAVAALPAPAAEAPASGSGDLTQWIDPFIGTSGTGHTTPAASVPFGMLMPGPDNADRGWSFSSGYQFDAPRVLGFSNTHISGAGIPELGDVLLMPAIGRGWSAATSDFAAALDKAGESARAGVYRVTLPEHGVRVEITTSGRVALHRWTALRDGAWQVLVDLQHGLHFVDGPRVTAADATVDTAAGEIHGTVHARNWVERQASFVLRFSQPVRQATVLSPREGDKAPRYLLDFEAPPQRVLEARVAMSTVDVAGARANLATAPTLSFRAMRAAADGRWQHLLGRIRIEADARTRRIFHSALYRALQHPSDIADADGRVRGPRAQVLNAPGGRYDSTLSLWDTFRAVNPLHTLLVPERVAGTVESLLAHHAQMGFLPLWTAWGRETYTMIGNPALVVLAEAAVKGLVPRRRLPAVLQAMVETSTRARPGAPAWAQRDWSLYERFGYLPFDQYDGGESVSKALEYHLGDDAVSRVARLLGDDATAERFARRAGGWRLLWDERLQVVRGRDSAGRFREPFDPVVATSPMNNPGDFTEGNAWQYSLTPALHDAAGFTAQLGGPAALGQWLDRFTTLPMPAPDKHLGQEAMIGQLAHGNEPGHHVPWLYAFSDRPGKGPALVRRIAQGFYGDGPDGLVGNDDAGQMGAWYVFAALGLYPMMPASGRYVLGEPLVRCAELRKPDGGWLRIERSARAGARLDGIEVDRRGLPHVQLLRGRRLELGPAG